MATWLPVPGWEGFYEVSDMGQVRSLPREYVNNLGQRGRIGGRILKASLNTGGYEQVTLHRGGQGRVARVHRLVAEAFIGPMPAGFETCHNDGDKRNNAASNLRYADHTANMRDALTHGQNRQAAKTHCVRGHEFTADNTYRQPDGGRVCRTCKRHADKLRKRAMRTAA